MSVKVGVYKMPHVVGLDFSQTNNGNEFVQLMCELTTPEGPALEPWTGYLHTDKAAARTIATMRMLGWTGNDLFTLTAADLPGSALADVREDTDKDGNVVGTRIAFLNSPSGLRSAPMPDNNRKALAMRLRGLVAAAPIVAPVIDKPEPAPAKPMRQMGDDTDDLPY